MTSRVCLICERPFAPKRPLQRACGVTCGRTLAGRTLKRSCPNSLDHANRVRRAMLKRATEALCRTRWRELSVREIEIFNFACKVGYAKGYWKGSAAVKRGYVKRATRLEHEDYQDAPLDTL